MNLRRAGLPALALAALIAAVSPQAASSGGTASFDPRDLKEWLSYIASDDLQGRAVFSTGLGLAASYIEGHLREWGVTPAGDNGFLQSVKVLGVKTTRHSTVTVTVAGERRTFADGDGIRFPRNAGSKQSLTVNRVEFAGYGLDAPRAGHEDYRGRDVSGAAVVWLGAEGPIAPRGFDPAVNRQLLNGRSRYATDDLRAAASIGVPPAGGQRGGGGTGQGGGAVGTGAAPVAPAGGRGPIPAADFTTVERLDRIVPPVVTGTDPFFEFLFSRAPVKYSELKRKADARETLPLFRLEGVTLTFDVNTDYEVVRTQLTQNVVAVIEGSDPELKGTYVAFGAHYDHVGYAEGELTGGPDDARRPAAPGRMTKGAEDDRIWNGADDDGSGTVTLLAIARAFALGPRPKRSVLLIWHAGEERGRWGSLYFADHATVPLDRIVAQLNIDMVGRNRENRSTEANTLYMVGSDRISTELDQVAQAANLDLARPLRLDYEFNDPSDPEQLYTRSDHYSYASRGIPVIFFTTGLHPDYHANTDDVSKIEFDKMSRIGEFIYTTGLRLAMLDHAPARDRRGARMGTASAPLTR